MSYLGLVIERRELPIASYGIVRLYGLQISQMAENFIRKQQHYSSVGISLLVH
jgi:hypothetical protein